MAENILRLKVDSSEFDSKIKSANDGLNRFFDSIRKNGKSVTDADKETIKYVQSLGSFEAKAQSAKGKVNEMSRAYTDLRQQYLHLTDAEKASPFGKSLSQSLDQLKGRITDAKRELNDIGREIGNLPTGTRAVGGSSFGGLFTGLNDAIQASSGGLSGLLGMLGKFGPQAAAIGGITTAVVGLGSSSISARKDIENLELNLGTLLGSAQAGRDLVKELQQYGVATPYDTNGLAQAAQTMLAYGVQAKEIMPLMRELGDIAMGDTQKLSSLALAFGQMTAVGTVQKQDLNQMANAGFGFNQIAASMNVTVAEFLDMVSKKKVSVEDIAKALHDATSEGGLFYNSAVNASKGLEGTFSNFEESLTNTKAQLGKLIEPVVLEVVNALGESIEGLTEGLGGSTEAAQTFKTIGEALGGIIKALAGRISDAINIAQSFGGIISEVGEIASPVINIIGNLASAVGDLLHQFGAADSNPFVQAIKALFNPLGALADKLNSLLSLIRKARQELIGESAEDFTNRRGGNNSPSSARKPVKAGDKITDSTYFSDRYGSVVNGDWIFNENGARVYNQNNPVSSRKPSRLASNNDKGDKDNRKANLTRSEITKKISQLTDEYANASAARKKAILSEISSLNLQKKQLDAVADNGKPKTPKKPKTATHTETDADRALTARGYYDEVARKASDLTRQMQEKIDANAIEAKEEGSEKRVAQINANRQKELAAIDKQIADLAKAEMEADQKAWLKTHPKSGAADYAKTTNGQRTLDDWKAVVLQMQTADGVVGDIVAKTKEGINIKFDRQLSDLGLGTLKELNSELQTLTTRQSLSKTNAEWREWGEKIDEVKRKIADMTAPDLSSLNDSNISAYIQDIQSQLSGLDLSDSLDSAINNVGESLVENAELFRQALSEAVSNGIDPSSIGAGGVWQKLLGGENADAAIQEFVDKLNEKLEEAGLKTVEIKTDNGGKSLAESQTSGSRYDQAKQNTLAGGLQDTAGMKFAQDVTNSLGSLTSGLKQMGIDVPEGIESAVGKIQGLMSIVQTVLMVVEAIQAMQAVSSVSIAGFSLANGGIPHAATGHIFPGNSFSGDLLPAMVNSGELILNRAQQGNLASQLSDADGYSMPRLEAVVAGEDLRFILNTNGRRTGRGELVTSNIKLW